MPPESATIIVGGGWAGIAAAIHLAQKKNAHQHHVTLIEAADQLGGRARTVMFGDTPVDNGQHIALGAYRNLLELLQIIGLDEQHVLSRLPLSLHVDGPQGKVSLHAPRLPAPLHLLMAFIGAQGLSVTDKRKTLLNWLRLIGNHSDANMTVTELLQKSGQSEKLNRYLWEPLCISALNTTPDKASAKLFQRVLRDSFMRRRADSDLLLPRYDMSHILPQPAEVWLKQQGVDILKGKRVTAINYENDQVHGVQLGDETISATNVVIATSSWGCAALTQSIPALQPVADNLNKIKYEPIATVYLKYKKPVLLQPTMQGFIGSTSQWLFDRRITSQPKLLAVVISADGEHAYQDKNKLIDKVISEVKTLTHLQDDPIDSLLIREKRATFSATPATEALRPENKTPLRGCWLAGDYTRNGYPATLEAAIISGKQCAHEILQDNPR